MNRARFSSLRLASALLVLLLASGCGSITGQAFWRNYGGDVTLAAGDSVKLVSFAHLPERFEVCDSEGRFKFEAVPPGHYLMSGIIVKSVWNGARVVNLRLPLLLLDVEVKPGRDTHVVLTNP